MRVLVRLNLATERQIAKALAYQLGFPYLNLAENPPDPTVVTLIPKDVALKRSCVAIRLDKNLLTVAMADPLLFSLVQDLEFQTGYRIKQVVATRADILEAIAAGYPDKALVAHAAAGHRAACPRRAMPAPTRRPAARPRSCAAEEDDGFEPIAGLKERSEAAPIIDLVDLVVKSAIKAARQRRPRRADGEGRPHPPSPRRPAEGSDGPAQVGPRRADRPPEDHGGHGHRREAAAAGRPHPRRPAKTAGTSTSAPRRCARCTARRWCCACSISNRGVPPLEELGFSAAALNDLRELPASHQHGMILVVGPTGSGKTTTLCSALMSMQSERTNIITIEDPIEYQLPGINQTQINEKIKLTFASALRSILRQDPDVILVGEIRDQETARIAMQAAQTGHLVLSTLHTDDAPSAVTRLTDIGVESYVIASATIGVVAQRLVRRLCPPCRRQYTPHVRHAARAQHHRSRRRQHPVLSGRSAASSATRPATRAASASTR